MSLTYDPVHWTPHKKVYDRLIAAFVGMYLAVFSVLQLLVHPETTAETLVIRSTGTLAFLMLHVVLCIGPLCRLDRRFLPLLYNRRHLGVTLFGIALVHGVFNIIQFHALGNVDPLVSVLTANTHFGSVSRFPFQVLGFIALLILFLMAATSHDFWLYNLTPPVWKALHMGVYVAYGLLVMHVMLGVIQLEKAPALIVLTGLGVALVATLHVVAASRQARLEREAKPGPSEEISAIPEGFEYACQVEEVPQNRAKLLILNGENIALFKYDGKMSAVHNLCRHQNGPLSEGRILDGCITCPWHGYQYLPENGQSPPPFTEKVKTYDVRVEGDRVFVNPRPYPAGTPRPPAQLSISNP